MLNDLPSAAPSSDYSYGDLVEVGGRQCRAIIRRCDQDPVICLRGASCRAHQGLREAGERAPVGHYLAIGDHDVEEAPVHAWAIEIAHDEVERLREEHDRISGVGRSALLFLFLLLLLLFSLLANFY